MVWGHIGNAGLITTPSSRTSCLSQPGDMLNFVTGKFLLDFLVPQIQSPSSKEFFPPHISPCRIPSVRCLLNACYVP